MKNNVVDINCSLTNVQHAFDQWRSTRAGRQSTPIALRRSAAALLDHYCAFHICRALGINANALKQWSVAATGNTSTEPPSPDTAPAAQFVRLPVPEQTPIETTQHEPDSLLTIELPNGIVIRTHRTVTLEQACQAALSAGDQPTHQP